MDSAARMFGFGEPQFASGPGEVTTSEGYGERMGHTCCGVCFGVLLFFGSFAMLGTNEKRAVQTAETIEKGRKAVVQTDTCVPSSMNDGQLVSVVSCKASPGVFPGHTTPGEVADQDLAAGLPAAQGIRLTQRGSINGVLSWSRRGEMYQVVEHTHTETRKKNGREYTHYSFSYSLTWSSSDESQSWECPGKTSYSSCVQKCTYDTGLNCQNLPQFDSRYAKTVTGQVNRIYLGDSQGATEQTNLWLGGNAWGDSEIPGVGDSQTLMLFRNAGNSHGGDQSTWTCDNQYLTWSYSTSCSPALGDWRWQWSYHTVPEQGVSVLAEQKNLGGGHTFDEWDTGDEGTLLAVTKIGRVQDGACDGKCMLDEMASENTIMTWLLRFLGWMLMFCGLQLIVAPIALAPEIIPCCGELIGGVVGQALCCVNCLFSCALSSLVIALAWLYMRPMLGIPLLLLCCACSAGGVWMIMHHKKKRQGAGGEGQKLMGGGKQDYSGYDQHQQGSPQGFQGYGQQQGGWGQQQGGWGQQQPGYPPPPQV
eukprot:TRINITY_DN8902_c0_g1_i1.p1 TRINITY_DN8902_c0_g1~~TRINITY_DN8902_c0_g1_i1.p1  ORF type:complete len:568 (+),score=156.49 TRINITY_DN8902_c0_g1_i1:101-1705(+)